MSGLPSGWKISSLGEVANIEMGQSPQSRFYNENGTGLPFFQGKAEFGKLHPTVRKWCSSPLKTAQKDDILLSVRAPVGPTNVAPERCCIGRGLAAIHAREVVDRRYLLHYFRSIEPWLSSQGTGTTFASISGKFIRELPVPVAPLAEQKRIADKLDRLLAAVETCKTRLDAIPAILKRFRQSVLAAATSGTLTAEWRAGTTHSLNDWRGSTLADICEPDRVITYGVIKLGDERPHGVPCLRTSNVRWLSIEMNGLKRIAPELSSEFARTVLKGTEVLVSVRGTLGGVTPVSPGMKGWNVSREVAVVPVDSVQADRRFVALWVAANKSQQWLRKVQKGVAYTGINIEDLRALPIELPSLHEQSEIVSRVDAAFAASDRLASRCLEVIKRLNLMSAAMLTKAFRGELVTSESPEGNADGLVDL